MDIYGAVYFIWNLINGKRYIGQTTNPLEVRMAQHIRGDLVVDKAIQKHGIENFRYGVIKTCATREELNYWEIYYIAALKSKAPYGCYNLTDGGEGTSDYKPTPEHKANISASLTGRHLSSEHRKNLSISMSGENNPNYSNHRSEQTKAKLRIARLGEKSHSTANRHQIAVKNIASLSGYIPSELNAAADYDVVVMGSRGFGGMDDSQGSVAKYVADNCSKPVIFAKGMPSDWDDDNNFVGGANAWKD